MQRVVDCALASVRILFSSSFVNHGVVAAAAVAAAAAAAAAADAAAADAATAVNIVYVRTVGG